MFGETKPWVRSTIYSWTAAVVVFMYVPIVVIIVASFVRSRFLQIAGQGLGRQVVRGSADSEPDAPVAPDLFFTSPVQWRSYRSFWVSSAHWPSRATTGKAGTFIKSCLWCRYSSRRQCLGLALLLWFTFVGIIPTWHTAIIAHLVWIAPIVTLVISIQVYGYDTAQEEAAFDLGANRFQVLREVTLPALAPGLFSGALFAFLLSWVNFSLSTYTTGADNTVTEWLYAKMIVGYTPLVPALGALSVYGSIIILFVGYMIHRARVKAKAASQ